MKTLRKVPTEKQTKSKKENNFTGSPVPSQMEHALQSIHCQEPSDRICSTNSGE